MRTLTPEEARSFYDAFGKRQDSQAFYESSALDELLTKGDFRSACSVLEFGCGTGKLAVELLEHYLPADATYLGVDISSTMVRLASERLQHFGGRASVVATSGEGTFPLAAGSVDRVVSTYVFDLLSEAAFEQAVAELRRVLQPEGLACLAGITFGATAISRLVMSGWGMLFAISPTWVGGCRPTKIAERLSSRGWRICHRKVVVAWGIASEVVVAAPPPAIK